MNYEQKYKEALENAREIIRNKDASSVWKDWLRNNFPELKESDDERMRKALIRFFQWFPYDRLNYENLKPKEAIAWLEKQGEHESAIEMKSAEESLGISSEEYNDIVNECLYGESKSADKVEPKFKVGDWIISNNKKSTYQVIEVKRGIYVIRDNADNHEYHIGIEECEKSGRLWTIQDAKDGDVLQCENFIFIFKDYNKESDTVESYCDKNIRGGIISFKTVPMCCGIEALPATKEQCDTLFTKMREAGSEWDAEKKELKKLAKFSEGDWIINNDVYGDVPVKIKEIGNYLYLCERQDGVIIELNKDTVLKEFKHWTIADAKDGDVLVSKYNQPFIYNGIFDEESVGAYCGIDKLGDYFLEDIFSCDWSYKEGVKPATKEQSEFLFSKMKEAGYEFDFEKKELMKIEHIFQYENKTCKENDNSLINEDEKMKKRIIEALQRYMPTDELSEEQEMVTWLEKQGREKAIPQTNEYASKLFVEEKQDKMKTPEESLGISSEKYVKIVNECIFGEDKENKPNLTERM